MSQNLALDSTYVNAFVTAYVETALWSSTDDDGTPLDENYGPDDIHPDTMEEMRNNCESFVGEMSIDLMGMPADQAGHDLWLTRSRAGAGYWDRGLGELGDRLTKAAHAYGSFDLYVGDEGTVYGS